MAVNVIQKVEFSLLIFLLVFNVFLLLSNPWLFPDYLKFNDDEIVGAPYDFIARDKIIAYPDKVVIEVEDYVINSYAPTGSMIPVLDAGANGIGVRPESEDVLHIGDIVTFNQDGDLIIHRIIEKGIDEQGTYFITKGDNNTIDDGKIRFSQIESVLVALIY